MHCMNFVYRQALFAVSAIGFRLVIYVLSDFLFSCFCTFSFAIDLFFIMC